MMDVGLEPTTQKNHGLSTTPFVKENSGVLLRLTTCKRLTNSLPKLSLLKRARRSNLGCWCGDVSELQWKGAFRTQPRPLMCGCVRAAIKGGFQYPQHAGTRTTTAADWS